VAKRTTAIYQLKVQLRDIDPPIWRRVQVWEDTSLAQLHRIIQIVMGWEDCHLHDFVIGRRTYSVPDPDAAFNERKVMDERRARLNRLLVRVGTAFEYVYDFGDDWRHEMLLEAILLPEPPQQYPRCIAGRRCGPPEDAGGPPGYFNYVEALADTNHEEHETMLQWRGPFDPEAFSIKRVNAILERTFRRPRPKSLSGASRGPRLVRPARGSPATESTRKRIRHDEAVPVKLTDRERDLILQQTLADDELTRSLRIVSPPGQPALFRYTLDELDELAGYVAAEANHASDRKMRKQLDRLHARLAAVLETHTDGGD
jgi:hypothetical protein